MVLQILERIVCLIIGYGFGLFQTAYLIGKSKGIDIRTKGSGNSGTTNMMRTMGTAAGVATFIGDILKGFVCILLVKMLFGMQNPDLKLIFAVYASLGVALGHDFPFYLNFKGGKGVACALGTIAALDWRMVIMPLFVFIMIVIFSRYVSLGSVTAISLTLIETIIFGSMNGLALPKEKLAEFIIVMAVIAGLCIFQHRSNIGRLLSGTERKFELRKKVPEHEEAEDETGRV